MKRALSPHTHRHTQAFRRVRIDLGDFQFMNRNGPSSIICIIAQPATVTLSKVNHALCVPAQCHTQSIVATYSRVHSNTCADCAFTLKSVRSPQNSPLSIRNSHTYILTHFALSLSLSIHLIHPKIQRKCAHTFEYNLNDSSAQIYVTCYKV